MHFFFKHILLEEKLITKMYKLISPYRYAIKNIYTIQIERRQYHTNFILTLVIHYMKHPVTYTVHMLNK